MNMLKATFATLEKVAEDYHCKHMSQDECESIVERNKNLYGYWNNSEFAIIQFKAKGNIRKVENLIGRWSTTFNEEIPKFEPVYQEIITKKRGKLGPAPGLQLIGDDEAVVEDIEKEFKKQEKERKEAARKREAKLEEKKLARE